MISALPGRFLLYRLSLRCFFRGPAYLLLFAAAAAIALHACPPASAQVQIERPDRKYLFLEDKYKKETQKAQRDQIKQRRRAAEAQQNLGDALPFDINAGTLSYDSSGNVVNAEGDVIITYSSLVAEGERAKVNIQSNEADVIGDVRISDISANLLADSAHLNLETGGAELQNAEVFFTEGEYRLFAKNARRESGDSYVLKDAVLSTCQCPEESACLPWSIRAEDASITRNGYGQAWNATLAVNDVPVFYFPYLFFPAKTERQSGLLPASWGGSRRSGFELELPLFLAIDRSTDMTLTGIYESKVHTGFDVELRRAFSRTHELETGHTYLNESARGTDLLGTNVDGLYEQTFDKDRYGGYLDHVWSGPGDLQYLMHGRYVSDDLFLREYEDESIAPYNSRFVTSQAILRTPLFGNFSADVGGEFNQSLVTNDDLVFQRAPEVTVVGVENFNPFGENPLGLRLVSNTNLSSVYFTRTTSYSGARSEAFERLRLPFHVRNYFDGSFEGNVRATSYHLTDPLLDPEDPAYETLAPDLPGDTKEFADNSTRLLPTLNMSLNTVLEKVFPLAEDSLLKRIGDLGSISRSQELVRVKHTIEPGVRYRIIPYVDQSENPLFDSYDRLSQRNVVTYGLTQRLYGRYNPRNEYVYGIEETAPELADLDALRQEGPVDPDLGFGFEDGSELYGDYRGLRQGSIAELANLRLYQSYNVLEGERDEDPAASAFSDVSGVFSLYPNEHVILRTDMDLNVEERDFSAYSVQTVLASKRGDNLRAGLRFVEDNVRQLETGLELRLTQYVKLGYYGRFDDLAGEFLEQRGGLRFMSSCRCWVFDVMVTDRINPEETKLIFNITLVGLGEIGNTFFTTMGRERENQTGAP